MSTFVPFTRDAVAMIRQGATPADLGWDHSFYDRVCRDHGIRTQPEPEPIRHIAAERGYRGVVWLAPDGGKVVVGHVVRGGAKVDIYGKRRCGVFDTLYRHARLHPEEWFDTVDLMLKTGGECKFSFLAKARLAVNSLLAPLRCRVDHSKLFGYRLTIDP